MKNAKRKKHLSNQLYEAVYNQSKIELESENIIIVLPEVKWTLMQDEKIRKMIK